MSTTIKTPQLKAVTATYWGETWTEHYANKDLSWALCDYTLHDFFDFPTGVQKIQLVGFDRPGKNRVEVILTEDAEITVDGEKPLFPEYTLESIIKKLESRRQTPLYVELYYWA